MIDHVHFRINSDNSQNDYMIHTAVSKIKRQHLVEVRSMSNPPIPVKMALESICLMLGEPSIDWKNIRSFILRDNFIPNILSFDAESMTYLNFIRLILCLTKHTLVCSTLII